MQKKGMAKVGVEEFETHLFKILDPPLEWHTGAGPSPQFFIDLATYNADGQRLRGLQPPPPPTLTAMQGAF